MYIVMMPQCSHIFHFKCISDWVWTSIDKLKHPDCPLCRKRFLKDSEEEAKDL